VKLTFVRLLIEDYPACFRFDRGVLELNHPIPMEEE
jgi:hypothetical protein